MAGSMKSSAAERAAKDKKAGKGGARGTCDLEANDLYNLLVEQKICCAYSGVPFDVTGFSCSPERIDDSLGYISENGCSECG